MKNYTCKLFLIFTFLFVFLTAQNTPAQEKSGYINLNYILSKLMSEPAPEINPKLIEEIRERKVDFILTSEDEERLKKSGANDLLIKTIDENASEKVKKDFQQKIYSLTPTNRSFEQIEQRIEYAKQFIRVFSNDPEYEQQVIYTKKYLPKTEEVFAKYKLEQELNKLLTEFNSTFKNKNLDDLFETGAKILDRDPQLVDVALVLASVGFDNLVENSDRKYLKQTFYYAEKSIKLLENNKISSDSYGAFEYQYKTKEFPDGRANALGWMHYFIGYIKYYHFHQREQAVLSFYKSITYKSETRERPIIYILIGDFYQDELIRLEQKKRQIESYPDNTPERDAKTNALLERAIDAFARAYFIVKTDKKTFMVIFDKLQYLLKMRHKDESTLDFDKLISNIIAKPMPDPADKIVPVK